MSIFNTVKIWGYRDTEHDYCKRRQEKQHKEVSHISIHIYTLKTNIDIQHIRKKKTTKKTTVSQDFCCLLTVTVHRYMKTNKDPENRKYPSYIITTFSHISRYTKTNKYILSISGLKDHIRGQNTWNMIQHRKINSRSRDFNFIFKKSNFV